MPLKVAAYACEDVCKQVNLNLMSPAPHFEKLIKTVRTAVMLQTYSGHTLFCEACVCVHTFMCFVLTHWPSQFTEYRRLFSHILCKNNGSIRIERFLHQIHNLVKQSLLGSCLCHYFGTTDANDMVRDMPY